MKKLLHSAATPAAVFAFGNAEAKEPGNDKDVTVKLKGNDYKSFGKVKVYGKKVFVKNIDPIKKSKHTAKTLKDEERYTAKKVTNENGSDIIRKAKRVGVPISLSKEATA